MKYWCIIVLLLASCDAIKIIELAYNEKDSVALKEVQMDLYGYTRMNTDYYMVIHYNVSNPSSTLITSYKNRL